VGAIYDPGNMVCEGLVSWGEVIKYLREAGYNGWLSREDLRDAPGEELLTEDLNLLRGFIAEAEKPHPAS
jgi:sugar phosphate isomerase/epimerase